MEINEVLKKMNHEIAMIGINHRPLPVAGGEDDIMINLAYSI
jgi:hypothetical protein